MVNEWIESSEKWRQMDQLRICHLLIFKLTFWGVPQCMTSSFRTRTCYFSSFYSPSSFLFLSVTSRGSNSVSHIMGSMKTYSDLDNFSSNYCHNFLDVNWPSVFAICFECAESSDFSSLEEGNCIMKTWCFLFSFSSIEVFCCLVAKSCPTLLWPRGL